MKEFQGLLQTLLGGFNFFDVSIELLRFLELNLDQQMNWGILEDSWRILEDSRIGFALTNVSFYVDQVGRRRLRGTSCNWSHSCPSLTSGGGGGGGLGVGEDIGGGRGGGAFSNNNESDWLNSTLGDWDSPTPPILATQYWGNHLLFHFTVNNPPASSSLA